MTHLQQGSAAAGTHLLGERPVHAPVRQRRWLFAIAAGAAALDLASKAAASAWLPRRGVDLPGPLDLKLTHNPGVAFGVGSALPTWMMVALTIGVAAVLATAAWRGRFASTVGPGLVLGGAVANIADRLEAGTVVDMLHLGWWPTFNVADVWITVGAVFLLWGEARAGQRQG